MFALLFRWIGVRRRL